MGTEDIEMDTITLENTSFVRSGRKAKICECCGGKIPMGASSYTLTVSNDSGDYYGIYVDMACWRRHTPEEIIEIHAEKTYLTATAAIDAQLNSRGER